jgi:hypothetical protein
MRMDVDTLDQDDLRREGGEEMEGMSLMVPRFSRKGKLYAGESSFLLYLDHLCLILCSVFYIPLSIKYPQPFILIEFPHCAWNEGPG